MTIEQIMRLADQYGAYWSAEVQGPQLRAALESAIREVIADAERYRRLRDELFANDVVIGEALVRLEVVGACPTVEEFDAAIDAAMAQQWGGKE